MKKIILFILVIGSNILNSQDYQWYIKNSRPKDGYTYMSPTNLNSIKVSGVVPNCIGCSPDIVRKDFFIIFENGECINTRPATNIDYYPILYNNFKINSTSGLMTYFYATNIYQGNDPPGLVSITDGTGLMCSNDYTLTATPEPFSVTHDFVPGEDVTLIIPKSLIDSCVGQLDLEFDRSFFQISPVFDNNSTFSDRWSYLPLTGTTSSLTSTGISDLSSSIGLNPYHYFNFKIVKPLPIGKKIGDPMSFTLKCGNNEIRKVTEVIRDVHDPNYIKVECIYKKPKPWYCFWCQDRYFVKYKLQFMNDGTLPVGSVTVNFVLPNAVKSNTLKVGNWSFGGTTGCGKGSCLIYNPNHPNVEFIFNEVPCGEYLTEDDGDVLTQNDTQFGWIEFCVELNTNPVNYYDVSLQPTSPTTNFGPGHIYSIENYIDGCTTNPNQKEDCLRTIYTSMVNYACNCDCPKKPLLNKP